MAAVHPDRPEGQPATYAYFVDARLQQVAYINAAVATPAVAFTYDASYERLATMTDGLGTTRYGYRAVWQLGAGGVKTGSWPRPRPQGYYSYPKSAEGAR